MNNYTLHLSSFHSFMLTSFTSTSSYKSSYTNKSSTSVYESLYTITMNIFRMKKYNKKFEKKVKNNKENVTELLFTINIFMKSWHSKRQWKSLSKYVEFEFSLQTIALLTIHDVFFDVTNSVKNQKLTENDLKLKLCSENESETYKEAVTSDDFKQWKQAMNNEYKFLEANFMWNLVKLFSDWCALKDKWIFHYK